MQSKIIDFLRKYELNKGLLDFEALYEPLTKITNEVEKNYSEWLGRGEIWDILSTKICELTKNIKETSYKLDLLISAEQLKSVSEELVNLISSLPRKYYFYFEIPPIPDSYFSSKNLTKDITLLEISRDQDNILKEGYYIRVSADGYCSGGHDCSAYVSARSKLKQFIFVSVLAGKFIIRDSFWLSFLKDSTDSIQFHDIENNLAIRQIRESEPFLRLLSLIQISPGLISDSQKYQNELKEPKKRSGISSILGIPLEPEILFPKIATFLETTDSDKNTSSLKNALEWGFDSLANQSDLTLSYMQLSIALEAILGGEKEATLVKRLSDRCAYLIGKSVTDREEIRKKFENFYDVRSDMIHGRTKTILKKDKEHLDWGRNTLREILISELNLYMKIPVAL